MPSLAITGSIGSGKSTAFEILVPLLGASGFSADLENGRLLDHDREVRELIITSLGTRCYGPDNKADRKFLFHLITTDRKALETLETILHPRLEAVWKPKALEHRNNRSCYYVAEIPLLYEKGLESFFDKTIVVGCSDSVRKQRLVNGRSLSAEQAGQWISMQEPQQSKIDRADHLVWNDCSPPILTQQLVRLAEQLRST
jgi:dephospho-CoA kinase